MKKSIFEILSKVYSKNLTGKSISIWHAILIMAIFYCTFIVPVLPQSWGRMPVRMGFTMIFIAGIMSMNRKNLKILYLSLSALVMEWVSGIQNWEFISNISRFLNVVFFLFVIISLLREMATAKVVTPKIIMGSISGYLLIGLLFSVLIAVIIQHDPGAFNVQVNRDGVTDATYHLGTSLYYGFVTLATLGYGDIVPLKPYTRSLATVISVIGQLYVATIIGILIGKYVASSNHVHPHKEE